ncbi:unnamed protein product [Linum trigynum]|uniref:Uncharacterized protein n=1 Tax=Linum trigynum TaxID=586398 RepID=A0AAV2EXH6_9ROSI
MVVKEEVAVSYAMQAGKVAGGVQLTEVKAVKPRKRLSKKKGVEEKQVEAGQERDVAPSSHDTKMQVATDLINDGMQGAADLNDDGVPDETASLSPFSNDDAGNFEIKRCDPVNGGPRCVGVMKGRVRQVADIFETRLNITAEIVHPASVKLGGLSLDEGGASRAPLDEYGSNLLDPTIGDRKRSLKEVVGGLEESPTPKRQFVEEKEMNDSVEEASCEWPQPDK